MSFQYIIQQQGKEDQTGTVSYKKIDNFMYYQLIKKKDSIFNQAYETGGVITLIDAEGKKHTIVKQKHVSLGQWDNYESDAPERIAGIQTVIEALKTHRKVRVSFDYIGHTRDVIASEVFKEYMEREGYTKENGYSYSIAYREPFYIHNHNPIHAEVMQ